jgi:spore coat polysaccharide biosynthesis protein SpsF
LILAVLQARMSSTRLPGKVLADVLGQPMIGRQIERLRRSRSIDELVVATSTDPSDDPVAQYLKGAGVPVHRGALQDVLARFCGVIRRYPAATGVIRLTADCPLADSGVIDAMMDRHFETGADFTNNTLPQRTFPHGLDAEVVRPEILLMAEREAADPYEREHVTPFVYRHPERFKLASIQREPSLAHLRWTVDYPADLDFVRSVYGKLYPANPAFGTADIVALSPNSAEPPP